MAANLARRGAGGEVARLLDLDERARALRASVETARAERARISKAVGKARREGADSAAQQAEARHLGDELAAA